MFGMFTPVMLVSKSTFWMKLKIFGNKTFDKTTEINLFPIQYDSDKSVWLKMVCLMIYI